MCERHFDAASSYEKPVTIRLRENNIVFRRLTFLNKKKKKKLRTICLLLFIIYCIAIVYFLIFSDLFGRGRGYDEMRYNLEPFLEIRRFIVYRNYLRKTSVLLNLFGNVLAFVPFGMLIHFVRNRQTGFFAVLLLSVAFSLCIECVQLVTKLGVFDVDDIIMNTFGGCIGYLIYYILEKIYRKRRKKSEK